MKKPVRVLYSIMYSFKGDRTIKIMLFHQRAAQAMKKVLLLHILRRQSYVRTCT